MTMTASPQPPLPADEAGLDLPLTDLALGVLNALFARCRPSAIGRVLSGRGTSAQAYRVNAGVTSAYLPEWLIRELEYQPVDEVRIVPATSDRGNDANLRDLGAAFVRLSFESADGKNPSMADEARDAVLARLQAFVPFPPVVLDEGVSVMAIWPLESPLRLDEPTGLERALRLQRDLTERLGGDAADIRFVAPHHGVSFPGQVAGSDVMPAYHPTWPAIVMPGCRGRVTAPDAELVTCAYFSDARVPAEALEAALQGGASTESQPKGTKR